MAPTDSFWALLYRRLHRQCGTRRSEPRRARLCLEALAQRCVPATSYPFLVKDINPGSGNSFPNTLTNVNGTPFFSANNGSHGFELWKSDGTSAGTLLVKDIFPGIGGSLGISINLTNVNGTLFFKATDG